MFSSLFLLAILLPFTSSLPLSQSPLSDIDITSSPLNRLANDLTINPSYPPISSTPRPRPQSPPLSDTDITSSSSSSPLNRLANDLTIHPSYPPISSSSSSSPSPHTPRCFPPSPLLRPEAHPLITRRDCHPLLARLAAMANCSAARTWRPADGLITVREPWDAPACRIDVFPAPSDTPAHHHYHHHVEEFGWADVKEAVERVLEACEGQRDGDRGGEIGVGVERGGFVVDVRGVVAWEQEPARRSEAASEVEREVRETRVGGRKGGSGVLCFRNGEGDEEGKEVGYC